MFIASSTKGSPLWNALIMLVLIITGVLITLMLVKLVNDEKDATGATKKFTLGAHKK